ncbi:MAG: hypothetical protein A2Y00_07595 [Omnitrophica WOR_2 bacterium GWF2_43_52]|nr:MAG: hypothetical protein A2Y01_01380 [Omnitrophica WOR_2 bacterium GWC2_44_8]OGX21309.1 MAG: hypothetical protein A2Y00_07595 [Omnitrophica WOR_2 bacterium GWF2_43_52]OGX53069.1 MAG: hypothetical protein A2460_09430 [Omnitrophica WOR_2 bacterium RIFOXYC2_FULL_43_9]HAH22074.1 hypothetical protein [Candidatus Omnitrophota bacterium]HBG62751.1 hypothetical protein [Candidatus Omnitrophota bacterium]
MKLSLAKYIIIATFLVLPVSLVVVFRPGEHDAESLDSLNEKFISALRYKTPSWTAAPAVAVWWEAKAAKEKGDVELSKQKLKQAFDLINESSAQKVGYDEILSFAGAVSHPIQKGKLKSSIEGAYTGIWIPQTICSPLKCPKGSFDQITDSHSALIFDVAPWYSHAAAYDYDLGFVIEKARYLSWDDLFSFENSIIISPIMARQISGKELPLVLTFKQHAELTAQYGSVLALSWIAGYVPDQPDWQGGSDYHPENIKDKAPKIKDVLDGKWDNYLRKIAREIKDIDAPLLMELTHEFNAPTFSNNIWWVFGQDGDRSWLEVCNPQYGRADFTGLDPGKMLQGIKEGKIKADCRELYNQYKSPYIPDEDGTLPDGIERMRDMWIHVKDIFDEEGVVNVSWFEHTGDITGTGLFNKIMPWNKIDYYWPGEGYIDFIGTSVYYSDAEDTSDKFNSPNENKTFHASANLAKEVAASKYWKDTPVLLVEFAYMQNGTEEKNIGKIFGEYIPRDFKNVRGFTFLDWPPQFGTDAEIAAWKKYVSDNPYYIKYPVIDTD